MIPLHYSLEGTPNSPVLILSNSLGTDLHMWDGVVPYLLPFFRILRYDTRGMGQSPVNPGPYTIDQLGSDVIQLMDRLTISKAHFCGLSMGGLIGQWLAIHQPERVEKLVICNTAAKIGTENAWNERIALLRERGMPAVVESSMRIWFTETFRQKNPLLLLAMQDKFIQTDVAGYSYCCAAIRDADFRSALDQIACPTLVVTGEEDPVTTVQDAKYLAENITRAKLEILAGRHLTAVEQPQALAEILLHFLVGSGSLDRGMHVRRTVLGNAHVDRANQTIDSFNEDFQQFLTRYAWGEIWTRPGLSKPERSLITLAMLIALNRRQEFRMHIRAALNNGLSVASIKEVILQSALYCGLPAANAAFHDAREEINLFEGA